GFTMAEIADAPPSRRSAWTRGSIPRMTTLKGAMNLRIIILGIAVVVAAFIGATVLMNRLWPTSLQEGRPQLVAVPPLPPLAGTSTVLAPAAIAISAIRDALEAEAARNLSGRPQNPGSQLLQAAELNFTITRGRPALTG